MKRALIVGGTGQIGYAVARHLAEARWHVTLTGRTESWVKGPWDFLRLDPSTAGGVAAATSAGFELLLSCVAFDEQDARELLLAQENVGRIIAISSASVYADARGRTLDEAADRGFPEFDIPLSETSPTVEAGSSTYSTRKVAMEETLQGGAKVPFTVLRPCAIHGAYSKHAREWWFVKRLLDGRKAIPLAYRGESRFQTTSVHAIAEAVMLAVAGQLPETVNVIDSNTPSVAEIGRAIMDVMGVEAELVELDSEAGFPPKYGFTPWSVRHPIVCSSAAPGSRSYAESVPVALHWLLEEVDVDRWESHLPQLAQYPRDLFDYGLDDVALVASTPIEG